MWVLNLRQEVPVPPRPQAPTAPAAKRTTSAKGAEAKPTVQAKAKAAKSEGPKAAPAPAASKALAAPKEGPSTQAPKAGKAAKAPKAPAGAKAPRASKAAKGKGHVVPELTPALLRQIHRSMVTSRVVDEVTIKMNRAGHGFFWIGGPGEEAFGTALALQLRQGQGPDHDYLHLHYRSNPILMAMGAKPIDTYRQMRGNQSDPYSGGRNFVNHYAIPEWNVVPVTPTIETQYLTAIGTAHVQRRHGGLGLTVVNGGDAGTAEGDFMCCLNWATRPGGELPMLIIVNHNGFGISTPSNTVQASPNLAQRAEPYGMKWKVVNGNDFFESWAAIAEAMSYIRTERKPFLLQANVSRLHGHSSATGGNREEGEDAITRFEARLIEQGLMTSKQCEAVWAELREQGRKDLAVVLEEPMATDVDRFIFKEA